MQIACMQKEFVKTSKNLGEYHDLYLQFDTLVVVDVFGNFEKMCLKIYYLDHAKFLSTPELTWQAALKKRMN